MQYNLSDPTTRIELLQRMLRYISFSEGMEDLGVSVDGVYNEETRQAVRRLQQMEKLPVTGVVDERTWNAIAERYALEQAKRDSIRISIRPNAPGERSDAVLVLQVILESLRLKYAYPPVPLTGLYDLQTAEAVREFQKKNHMPVTGEANRATWLRLAEEYEQLNGI